MDTIDRAALPVNAVPDGWTRTAWKERCAYMLTRVPLDHPTRREWEQRLAAVSEAKS